MYPPLLEKYLPRHKEHSPFVTLTYAQSLDACIAGDGRPLQLSCSESLQLTHVLRTRHSAILVGSQTAITDNPRLNARIEGLQYVSQPIPIIIDPHSRYHLTESTPVIRIAKDGTGKPPIVFVSSSVEVKESVLNDVGGFYVRLPGFRWPWRTILEELHRLGIKSVMIEGGATVIAGVLSEQVADVVIVTISPRFAGAGTTVRAPTGIELCDVSWLQIGSDAVFAAKMKLQ